MSTDLQASISSAISQANAKSAEKSEGNFNEQVARDRVSAAQSRIGIAESKVDRASGEKAKIDEQLMPPPTKDISTGGKNGGTKTVVDQEEVRRLNSSKSNFDAQIAQAKQEVEKAQSEAQAASSDVLSQTGINQETQTEIDSLMSKATSIQNTLSEGGSVPDSEIKGLTEKFAEISGGLTDENNPAGLMSEAFYDPFAKTMENIAKYLDSPVEESSSGGIDPSSLPEANKVLYDVGISLEDQEQHFTLGEDLDKFAKGLQENNGKFGGEFTEEKFRDLNNRQTTNTSSLNDTQKNTGVIKENSEVIGAIKTQTGFSE